LNPRSTPALVTNGIEVAANEAEIAANGLFIPLNEAILLKNGKNGQRAFLFP
jgi:hypothetical protein